MFSHCFHRASRVLAAATVSILTLACAFSEAGAQTVVVKTADTSRVAGLPPSGTPGKPLEHPLAVRVTDKATGAPLAGVPIRFESLMNPEKGGPVAFETSSTVTNANGIASVKATLGSKAGDYVVGARLDLGRLTPEQRNTLTAAEDSATFRITARSRGWPLVLLMELTAGLALFMFGISQLSSGLRHAAGNKLRRAMELMTKNRILALTVGMFITVLFQSSCATTVMLVSFVQAGLLKAVQTLAIILGADIGTTVTVQLFAFKATDYTLVAVAIGFFLFSLARKSDLRHAGQAIMGLGLLFSGMALMQQSTAPLRTFEPFIAVLTQLNSVFPAVLVGAVFTALLRSSAAFIGIVIVFASQGLLSLQTGIALCLGANVGTCVTAILASFNASYEAKRVALAHVLFKLTGVALLVLWVPTFAQLVTRFSGEGATIERLIANAHTFFNVGLAVVFLPFLTPFNALIQRLLGDKRPSDSAASSLDKALLLTPPIALSAAKREIIALGRESQEMVRAALEPLLHGQARVDKEALINVEHSIDARYEAIREFLSSLMERSLNENMVSEALLSLRALHDFEQIADIVEDRIIPRVEILRENGIMLSENGRQELQRYHVKVLKQISRSLELFDTLDVAKASKISDRFEKYCMLAYEMKDTHFRRLQAHVPESERTSNVHLNLLSALMDISNLATNVARHMKEKAAAEAGIRSTRSMPEPISGESVRATAVFATPTPTTPRPAHAHQIQTV